LFQLAGQREDFGCFVPVKIGFFEEVLHRALFFVRA
jgi:hypothetical protein